MGVGLAQHSVLMFNLFFIIFAALPILAPILLAYGYTSIAGVIYRLYGFTCHQMPSHSDFIGGHQVAVCQRCNAMHIMLAVAGLMYALRLFRPSLISFKWFLLFMILIGIDGGMAFVSELSLVMPIYWFWILGIAIIIGVGALIAAVSIIPVVLADGPTESYSFGYGRGPTFGQGVGCGQGQGFVDEDGDGVCDNAGLGRRLGRGYGPNFVDEDGDGVCDNAGSGVCFGRQGGAMGRGR